MSTTDTLAQARADLHAAVAAHDPNRRRQYALSSRDYATEVLLAPDATPQQIAHAGYYLDDATAMLTR
jgi:hypothetical protein